MNFKSLFNRRKQNNLVEVAPDRPAPQPLRIEGIAPAPLTAEPDDAELAAQAVLELLVGDASERRNERKGKTPQRSEALPTNQPAAQGLPPGGDERGASYYQHLAERMRKAHAAAHWRTVRFLAFAEQELKKPHLPATGPGSLELLETEILKRQDVAEREGGDTLKRWQMVLAQVTVRLMAVLPTGADDDADATLQ